MSLLRNLMNKNKTAAPLLRANYHTHTTRCGHAGADSEEDYIKTALAQGIRILGFSDHTPWPYRTGYEDFGVRMRLSELDNYEATVRTLARKYGSDATCGPREAAIRIYCGLECEYFPEYTDFLQELHERMDYLILGAHWTRSNEFGTAPYSGHVTQPRHLYEYAENVTAGMESGLFRNLAHPDLIFSDYPFFDSDCEEVSRRICDAALRTGTPLEFNISGRMKMRDGRFLGLGFPCLPFWEIAGESGNEVLIGCDAHGSKMLTYRQDQEFALSFLSGSGFRFLDVLPGLE